MGHITNWNPAAMEFCDNIVGMGYPGEHEVFEDNGGARGYSVSIVRVW